MTTVLDGADVTSTNLAALPSGFDVIAGYVTGSDNIIWSDAQWGEYPDAVRIDQSPVNTALDETADVLDFERGAATLADVAPWALAAQASYAAGRRPGQRRPAIYASASSLTAVCNALAGARVTGVGLWVADWNDTQAAAAAAVQAASGPYPVVAVQYQDAGTHDLDVFAAAWVSTRSAPPQPAPPARPAAAVPPGQWENAGWQWAEVTVIGKGLDGNMHAFAYSPAANIWAKVL